MKIKPVFSTVFLLLSHCILCAQNDGIISDKTAYEKGRLLVADDFSNSLSNWVIENKTSPHSEVSVKKGKLVVDVDSGATLWLDKKLSGNILIQYERKVLLGTGNNDRLSDVNQFWMAHDPKNQNLFTRDGTFHGYDFLQLYYFGIGGNGNTTTRFRKYLGNGERFLITDLKKKKYLLEPNKTYLIQTVFFNGTIKVYVNHREYFSYIDKAPLQSGYFGFRTTQSRQEIDNLKIFRLNTK